MAQKARAQKALVLSGSVVYRVICRRVTEDKHKKMATKVVTAHPKYLDMTTAAIDSLGERGGSSRQAILRYILEHYKTVTNEKVVNSHLKMALRRGVENGDLKQSKGTGASGSFKLGEMAKAKAKAESKAKVEKVKTVKPKTDKKEKVKPAKAETKAKVKVTVKKTTSLKSKTITTPQKAKTVVKASTSKAKSALKTPKRTPSTVSKTKRPKAEKVTKKVAIKKPKTPRKTPKKSIKK